jgi:hypothetical protein
LGSKSGATGVVTARWPTQRRLAVKLQVPALVVQLPTACADALSTVAWQLVELLEKDISVGLTAPVNVAGPATVWHVSVIEQPF